MKKLALLNSYLASVNLFTSDQLSCWTEEISLKIGGKDEGSRVLLHTNTYRAVILVENYNHALNPIELFNAHVAIWLAEHDNRTDLKEPAPNIAIDLLDDNLADIELTLMFEEDVYISRDDSGAMTYKNRQWSLLDSEVDVAEAANVTVSIRPYNVATDPEPSA